MDYRLANYLFHSETLYHFEVISDKLQVISENKSDKILSEVSTKHEEKENSEKQITKLPNSSTTQLQNKVLILVNQLSDAEKDFLGKILSASNLSFETIDLIELSKTQMPDYQAFTSQKITKTFISFGVGLSKLGWNQILTIYQTKTIENVNFLLADDLSKIMANVDLKKALWANLQKLFPKKIES